MKTVLIRSHYALLVAGILALGYCGIVFGKASAYQAHAREQLLHTNAKLSVVAVRSSGSAPFSGAPLRVGRGFAVVGRVEIPSIELSAMIAEGVGSRALRVAVGHVPGTALPWQSGNVALVAHRDTFFRRLGEIKDGDVIRLTVPGDEYTYQVMFTDIVSPRETWVLQPVTGDTLTLITCYPFRFIGAAPKRFVVRARRLESVPVMQRRTSGCQAGERGQLTKHLR